MSYSTRFVRNCAGYNSGDNSAIELDEWPIALRTFHIVVVVLNCILPHFFISSPVQVSGTCHLQVIKSLGSLVIAQGQAISIL